MLRKTTLASFLLAAFPAIAQDIAIVGGTLIDGNGGAPVADAVIIVAGRRITALGPRTTTPIPPGAKIIDATNRYIVPGFIDTNVHLSLYGGARDRYETIAKYYPRESEIVLEAAQIDLRYGVTTVRDSYGMLLPLIDVRDRIARGAALGARVLAAGNIVGWGGPYSVSFLRMSRQSANFAAFPVLTQDSQGPQEVAWADPHQPVKSSCIRPLTEVYSQTFSLPTISEALILRQSINLAPQQALASRDTYSFLCI